MTDLRRIVWLASYPKSGNTWTRIFLANYLYNANEPVPINQVHRFAMGDAIRQTYSMVAKRPIDADDTALTLRLRDYVLRGIVANGADVNFVKTHSIRTSISGRPLIPKQISRSAVYILRNPLDVTLSYARHFGLSHLQTAQALASADNAIAATKDTVRQFLGSWSDHVRSWTETDAFPVLTLRYEDLHTDPKGAFSRLLQHIGVPVDDRRLEKAIRFSSFDEVSKQERDGGFDEKSQFNTAFFAKGKSGQWKSDLSSDLVEKIRVDHCKVMKKFGYFDE